MGAVKAWNIVGMEVEPHHPRVLDTADEGRVIVMHLAKGEAMQEHKVHERTWLVVVSGAIEIDDADGETLGGGPGLLAEWSPNERRGIRATEDTRLMLLLSPWPGKGHPSRASDHV